MITEKTSSKLFVACKLRRQKLLFLVSCHINWHALLSKHVYNLIPFNYWLLLIILLQLVWLQRHTLSLCSLFKQSLISLRVLWVLSVVLGGYKVWGEPSCSCFFHQGKKLQSKGIPQWEQTDHRGAQLSMGLSTPRLLESLSHRRSHTQTHIHNSFQPPLCLKHFLKWAPF